MGLFDFFEKKKPAAPAYTAADHAAVARAVAWGNVADNIAATLQAMMQKDPVAVGSEHSRIVMFQDKSITYRSDVFDPFTLVGKGGVIGFVGLLEDRPRLVQWFEEFGRNAGKTNAQAKATQEYAKSLIPLLLKQAQNAGMA